VAAAGRRTVAASLNNTYAVVTSGCRFANNTAGAVGGGALFTRDFNASIFTSTFTDNRATGDGGALVRVACLACDCGRRLGPASRSGGERTGKDSAVAVHVGIALRKKERKKDLRPLPGVR
jgi:hypothetical protein